MAGLQLQLGLQLARAKLAATTTRDPPSWQGMFTLSLNVHPAQTAPLLLPTALCTNAGMTKSHLTSTLSCLLCLRLFVRRKLAYGR